MSQQADLAETFLCELQDRICAAIEQVDGGARFEEDAWQRPAGGGGRTRVLCDGAVFEQAGVNFSRVSGHKLPPSATAHRPDLAGGSFIATGVSLVLHPKNPHVPTTHMNVRYFSAGDVWWFGGGFDLTPYIPYEEDVIGWHRAARAACDAVSPQLYPVFRRQCDEYFFLKHRGEARGVGGIFYDDVNDQSPGTPLTFEQGFALMKSVGHGYLKAYREVIDRRRDTPWTERERTYQLYRRGRYVEFNLVFDRGTLFGLQSGGRTEAILVSMPPLATWSYQSPEPELDAKLMPYLTELRGRDWLA